ncbi:MAG TPA: hypothetical protein VLF93_03450 [Candidatus Saccharimonadales bacterium]|nr:hypothetical protein [Candidatus Saccharimonadales bacterium]
MSYPDRSLITQLDSFLEGADNYSTRRLVSPDMIVHVGRNNRPFGSPPHNSIVSSLPSVNCLDVSLVDLASDQAGIDNAYSFGPQRQDNMRTWARFMGASIFYLNLKMIYHMLDISINYE